MASSLPVPSLTDGVLWALVARYARCADSGLDPDEWFPVSIDAAKARHEATAAIAVCAGCLVRDHQLADDNIPAALLAFAEAKNATRLMLGEARHTRLLSLLPWPGTTQRVIRGGGGIGLHIVTRTPSANGASPPVGEPTREGECDGAEQHPARPRVAGSAIGPQTASPG
jgi:K+-sensing histidine kinase KdpD